jgi:hypothetical protein
MPLDARKCALPALAIAMLLAAGLSAGCATAAVNTTATSSEQARCEQHRGGGVWMAAAGACFRGGGG